MDSYTVKYKPPGCLFWRKIRNVVHRNLDDMASKEQRDEPGYEFGEPVYWLFKQKSGVLTWIPFGWAIRLEEDHVLFTANAMSRDSGQQIQVQ